MTNTKNRDTIDIETAGNSVDCRLEGRTIVELVIKGDGAANYKIDARESDSASWVQDVGPTYSGSANYMDTVETGWAEIRVRCTSGTGTVDDSAEIILCAGGA